MDAQQTMDALRGPITTSKLIIDIKGPAQLTRTIVDNLLRCLRLARVKHQLDQDVAINYRITEK